MRPAFTLAAAALLAMSTVACESSRPATRAGAAVDRAGTATGSAVGRAAENTGQALGRAGDWVRDRTN
jgi:hypothetical protein